MPKSIEMKRLPLFPSLLLVGAVASFGAMALHTAGVTALRSSSETSAEVGLATNASPTSVTNFSPQDANSAVELTPVVTDEATVDDGSALSSDGDAEHEYDTPPVTAAPVLMPVAQLPAGLSQRTEYSSDAEKASELLRDMNDARANAQVDVLASDADLSEVALVRATDLIENGYFDHYSPAGENAFTELGIRSIYYRLAGENLARNNYPEARTVPAAFDGLMGSPGHRANILEPRFTRAGVAVVKSGKVWYYVTVFAD